MKNNFSKTTLSHALGLALLGLSAHAFAQDQQAAKSADAQATDLDKVTVTGFRHSLEYSTQAKRDNTGFTDSIFAEDIGKFPDNNIAESLQRIPGVQLQRDVDGQGLNISIRGLGNSFTKTLINGGDVATASVGLVDQNGNREVDLNLFPTEFFDQLTVNKTPKASITEGGIGGTVDMRNSRPFDNPGTHVTYNVQGSHNDIGGTNSPRGSLIGSWTNDSGTFGVLAGASLQHNKTASEGFESIGWTNPNLSAAQCGSLTAAQCSPGGGNGWTIPGTAPNRQAVQDAGIPAGTTIDNAWLLAHNPGLSTTQISEALIPRLGRPMYTSGYDDRNAFVASLEWRPSDNAHYYVDTLYSLKKTENDRIDMDLIGRNGAMIPENETVDANNVVQNATFANAQFFLEARQFIQRADYWRINPGATWWFGDDQGIRIDAQASRSVSTMDRTLPTFYVNSPYTTVQYDGTGKLPAISSTLNLDDPNAGWTKTGGRFSTDEESRRTTTNSAHVDVQFGQDDRNVKFGLAYDDDTRLIEAWNNNTAYQNYVLGNVSDATIAQYLQPGPAGFVTFDFNGFKNASNWYYFAQGNTLSGSGAAANAPTGGLKEKTFGTYLEANGDVDVFSRKLRYNAGVRYASTKQEIGGPVTIAGVSQWQTLDGNYGKVLPSMNLAWDVADSWVVRFAASKTLTRPNPSSMLPNTTFSDPSAQQASQGNPDLKPYTSKNFDLGVEWYTGEEGMVGLTGFQKTVSGYTYQGTTTMPFLDLGVPYASLTDQQKLAIDSRGGPDQATVSVTQQVNAEADLKIQGMEAIWVQPLTVVLNGLGFSANYTKINLSTSGAQSAALQGNLYGIAPTMWNSTLYWENYGASVRLSYNHTDAFPSSGLNENSVNYARRYFYEKNQLDLSAGYTFSSVWSKPQLTLNVTNLTHQLSRGQYFAFDNAPYEYYEPGRTITLGIRGTF